jgi:general L-amino acid transport system substrate-binding protein
MNLVKALAILGVAVLTGLGQADASPTMTAVKVRGHVLCGVNLGLPGFASADARGNWSGLDVDVCRAVAAALFGDAAKVKFVPLSATERLDALHSRRIDILARNTTWTLQRDTLAGFEFTVPVYYDGQGVMVPKKLGLTSIDHLNGLRICMLSGTTTELNFREYYAARRLTFQPVAFERNDEMNRAFFSGQCDAITSDASQLAAIRASGPAPFDYVILPEMISKEPLTPVVRHGDEQWKDLVSWSIFAMITAEEMGLTSANVDAMLSSTDPNMRQFLGLIPGNGRALGIEENWAYNIVKQVGSYGEVFERNVGSGSKLQLHRRLNRPYTHGGLMYAPPMK